MKKTFAKLFKRREKGQKSAEIDQLTRLVRRYTVEQQQVPRDLLELVTLKYIAALPEPPEGQRFVIDRTRVEVRLENATPGSLTSNGHG